jgi:DNA-binding CsgD family transcriptional regulator
MGDETAFRAFGVHESEPMTWSSATLRRQVRREDQVLARAAALLGPDRAGGLEAAAAAAEVALRHGARAAEGGSLGDLMDLWCEVTAQRAARRAGLLARVDAALAQLRSADDMATTLDRGVRVLCDVCGFDRAAIFSVDGSVMRLRRIHIPADPRLADAVHDLAWADPPRLTHRLVETEMIRRRGPVLVTDAASDPRTHKPLVDAAGTRSYVAAPIQHQDAVIGFLHADRRDSDVDVDEDDRDALAAFAEGFGAAVERALLLERLETQRHRLLELARGAQEAAGPLTGADLGGERAESPWPGLEAGHDPLPAPDLAAGPAVALIGDLAELTPREHDVLRLMSLGLTNPAIAEHLAVGPATVKSHVKRILRKLRAANRSEAIARYLRSAADPALL